MQPAIDRDFLLKSLAEPLFKGQVSPQQAEGITAIINYFEQRHPKADWRWIAYCLATAYHETAYTMQPVRETLADSDEEAIARLERAFAGGKLPWVKTIYWRRDDTGHSWLGRGLVQLTHRRNYEAMGRLLSVDLVGAPERAMQMDLAVQILVEGMIAGAFTTHKLSDWFNADLEDWVQARRIVNGMDRAEKIAGYGHQFLAAMRQMPAMALADLQPPGLLRRLMQMLDHASS